MKQDMTCLLCGGTFKSPGNHIRKCGTCYKNDKLMELYDQTDRDWDETFYPRIPKRNHRVGKRTLAREDS